MPEKDSIGKFWMGWNKQFIHGPRFTSPDKFNRLWVQGYNKSLPRKVMGETKDGKIMIQSVLTPIRGELHVLMPLAVWNEKLKEYEFPSLKSSRNLYFHPWGMFTFYGLAFTKQKLAAYKKHLKERKHKYRVIEKEVKVPKSTKTIKLYQVYAQ